MTDQRFDIPPGSPPRHCASCKAEIHWIVTRSGRRMPVNPDGVSHFATCPNAAEHRGAAALSGVKKVRA